MKTIPNVPLFNAKVLLPVAADVSKANSHYCCELEESFRETEASNGRDSILGVLGDYRDLAREAGFLDAILIVEPTGGYERPLLRAAREIGMRSLYANAEAVKKAQVIQDGTSSKSDRKDPRTILTVAKLGKLMRARDLSGRWQALRQMNVFHDRLETDLTRLKGRAHRLLDELFPTLDFSAQWLFGDAAMAAARLYRLNPYAMADDGLAAAARRLRAAGLRPQTVRRLVDAAMKACEIPLERFYADSLADELEEVYEAIRRARERKAALERRFEEIYDELLESGEARIQPARQVLPKVRLAMIHGETGPLDDFTSIRELRKYGGMNLRLKDSGKSQGARRLSKKGRPMMRKVISQTCLPLVRKGELFGEEYHRRKEAGTPGRKAMAAIANKFLKMLFGLHRSRSEFDPARVFDCSFQPLPNAA